MLVESNSGRAWREEDARTASASKSIVATIRGWPLHRSTRSSLAAVRKLPAHPALRCPPPVQSWEHEKRVLAAMPPRSEQRRELLYQPPPKGRRTKDEGPEAVSTKFVGEEFPFSAAKRVAKSEARSSHMGCLGTLGICGCSRQNYIFKTQWYNNGGHAKSREVGSAAANGVSCILILSFAIAHKKEGKQTNNFARGLLRGAAR